MKGWGEEEREYSMGKKGVKELYHCFSSFFSKNVKPEFL